MSESEKSEETMQESVQESVQEEKITNPEPKKEKDPKRVAQGKRLAQISKAAKEKKMREKIAEESQLFDISVNYSTLGYIITPVVVFAGMYLYFSKNNNIQNQRPDSGRRSPEKPPTPKIKKNVVSLFD